MRARLLLVLACTLSSCAHGQDPGSSSLRTGSSIAHPVSTPVAPWTPDERARAFSALASAFSSPALENAGLVVLAADGATLFARRATSPLTPASSLKLLIAATALDALGPQRRLETTFVALGPPDAEGVIEGSLWLVGGGDPLLSADDLRGGVAVLARAGVRRIAGDLVVDATAFSGPEQNPLWDPSDLGYDYAAGTSAMSLDEDVAEFRVIPASPGDPAKVQVRPPNTAVGFTGSIATAPFGADSDVSIVRDAPAPGAPSDRNEFVLAGHIAAGEPQSFFKPVVGVASYAGGAAAAMLAERSIRLDGSVRSGAAPFAARALWLHRSQPLAALLREMLVSSDNHTAEQLLRIVGFELSHSGTERGGIAGERAYLARNDIPLSGLHVVDGSGLSPQDRIAPIVLARLLAVALRGPAGDTLLHALPLVGMEGTVRHHELTTALGRARAKSGHLDGVNALAGTVQTRRHGRVTFAFIVNGAYADADAVTVDADRALDALATM